MTAFEQLVSTLETSLRASRDQFTRTGGRKANEVKEGGSFDFGVARGLDLALDALRDYAAIIRTNRKTDDERALVRDLISAAKGVHVQLWAGSELCDACATTEVSNVLGDLEGAIDRADEVFGSKCLCTVQQMPPHSCDDPDLQLD